MVIFVDKVPWERQQVPNRCALLHSGPRSAFYFYLGLSLHLTLTYVDSETRGGGKDTSSFIEVFGAEGVGVVVQKTFENLF